MIRASEEVIISIETGYWDDDMPGALFFVNDDWIHSFREEINMDKVRKNKVAIVVFLLPAVLLFVGIIIIPIFCSGWYSLLDWDGITDGVFVGLKNYQTLFTSKTSGFSKSLINMMMLAFGAVFIQLPFALFLALVLARGIKGERFFVTVFFIPVLLSTVVIGQLWVKMYNPDYGVVNSALRMLGLDSWCRTWLGEKETVMWAVFIPIIWQYVGYHMLLMYAGIKSINADLREAACIDGANYVQTCRYILIPLLKPVLRVCLIFGVTGAFKSFDMIYVLTNGGPAHASEVPSTLMFTNIFLKNKYGSGSAVAIFIIVICFAAALLIKKFFPVEEDAV